VTCDGREVRSCSRQQLRQLDQVTGPGAVKGRVRRGWRSNLSWLICGAWLAGCPAWAGDQDGRFFEYRLNNGTETFDFNTVQMIQPGRFTIVSTTIDDPDAIKLELKTLDALKIYCDYHAGKYSPPKDLFVLGPPDLPVKAITVHNMRDGPAVSWSYPYKRLQLTSGDQEKEIFFACGHYVEQRDKITNGIRTEYQFDCKRGMAGIFFELDDRDPSKVHMSFVQPGTVGEDEYLHLCRRATHQIPWLPQPQ
jgi:hypothetical protein